MDNAISILEVIRKSLGTLSIQSTRSNLDVLLGCMQLCDRAIAELRVEQEAAAKIAQEKTQAVTEGENG